MNGGSVGLQIFLLVNVFVVGGLIAIAIQHARAHFKHIAPKQQKSSFPILPADARQRIIDEAEEAYQRVLQKSTEELENNLESTTNKLNEQIDKMGAGIVDDEMQRYRQGLDELRQETASAVGGAQAEIEKHQLELRAKLAERQAEMDAELIKQQSELEAKLAARTAEAEAAFKAKQAEYAAQQAELEATLNEQKLHLKSTIAEREAKLADQQAEMDAELLEAQKKQSEKQAQFEAKLEQEMIAKRQKIAEQIDTKVGDAIPTFLSETLGQNVDLGAQTSYLLETLEEHKDELKKAATDEA